MSVTDEEPYFGFVEIDERWVFLMHIHMCIEE